MGDVPEGPLCMECADTCGEIAPWIDNPEELRKICLESETFRSKVLRANNYRMGREDASWPTPDRVEKCNSFRIKYQYLFDGYATKEEFAEDHHGAMPEDLGVPAEHGEELCTGEQNYFYFVPAKVCVRKIVERVDANVHTANCMPRQLYQKQAEDTQSHLEQTMRTGHPSWTNMRSRSDIQKDALAIAHQRGLAPKPAIGAASSAPPGGGNRVLRPAAFIATAKGLGPLARTPRDGFPNVPKFPGLANAVKPSKPASDSGIESGPGRMASTLHTSIGSAPNPTLAASSLGTPRPSVTATCESPIRSPPTAKARMEERPSANAQQPPPKVVNLGDLKSDVAMRTLGSSTAKLRAVPDDARSSKSSGSRCGKASTLEKQFPDTPKHERPMKAYPWDTGLQGKCVKEALQLIRKNITATESSDCEVHHKLKEWETYIVAGAELNLPKMLAHEILVLHSFVKKLKPVMHLLPVRNYLHLAFRYALEDAPLGTYRGGFKDWFFRRLWPQAGEKVSYDPYDPRIWSEHVPDRWFEDGFIPNFIKDSINEFIYAKLVTEGQKNMKLLCMCAAQVTQKTIDLGEKYQDSWSGVLSDARAILQFYGETPFQKGASGRDIAKLIAERSPLLIAIQANPAFKGALDLANFREAGEKVAWPEVLAAEAELAKCENSNGSWDWEKTLAVTARAIGRWPDWQEQIRESALPHQLQPKITKCFNDISAEIEPQNANHNHTAVALLALVRKANVHFKDQRFGTIIDKLDVFAKRQKAEEEALALDSACVKILEASSVSEQFPLLGALTEVLPEADSGRRLNPLNDTQRNNMWQVLDTYCARAGEVDSVEKFLELSGVAERFRGVVDLHGDAEFMSKLKQTTDKIRFIEALAKVRAKLHAYIALGNCPEHRIGSEGSFSMIAELMKSCEELGGCDDASTIAMGTTVANEFDGVRSNANDAIKAHGDAHVQDAWPPLSKEWVSLKKDAGGAAAGAEWKLLLGSSASKDFCTVHAQTKDTLQKVDVNALTAQTKSTHIARHLVPMYNDPIQT